MPISMNQLATRMGAAALITAAGCHSGITIANRDAGAGAGGAGTGGAETSSSSGTGEPADAGLDAPDAPDAPDVSDPCGICAWASASGWDDATIVWIGAEADAPGCPPDVPALHFEGYADLSAPFDCGTCSCAPPSGTCGLPTTMTANAATCALGNASTAHTPFDPQGGWDGTCDSSDAIPSGKLCSGVKCVQSLTVGPLSQNESGCAPSLPPAPSPPTWGTFARGCKSQPLLNCDAGNGPLSGVCLATPGPGSGFRGCIYHDGDQDCPSYGPYSEKHVFYPSYQDTRACTPCTCDAPAGSKCSAQLSVYTDGACSTPAYTATIDATGPACHDLPAGSPLGSKAAGVTTYVPGACAPGGGMPMGSADPIQPATMCCLPP